MTTSSAEELFFLIGTENVKETILSWMNALYNCSVEMKMAGWE